MWGEHNLSVSEIISKLATKGAVNVNKDKISINEHFHMEHNDIPVLCLTADCITPLRLFRNVRDISLELGINVDTVLRVCRRLQKTTRNVCFRWMDQNSDEYPKLKVPVSIESLRLDYVEKKQGICAGGTVVPRRHARARSLALDAEIYEQISQSRKKFVSVQRRNISLMVLKMLGRKFKIPGSDDVFITSDVCCKNGHASLFYKYYSLRKFPKSKPNLVSSYDFAECESMLHSKQFADWLPKDFNNNQSKIDSSTSSSETSTISDEETDVSSEEEYKSLPGSSTIKIKSSKVRHLAVISNLVLDLLKVIIRADLFFSACYMYCYFFRNGSPANRPYRTKISRAICGKVVSAMFRVAVEKLQSQ